MRDHFSFKIQKITNDIAFRYFKIKTDWKERKWKRIPEAKIVKYKKKSRLTVASSNFNYKNDGTWLPISSAFKFIKSISQIGKLIKKLTRKYLWKKTQRRYVTAEKKMTEAEISGWDR